jgi:hypothetical protein
LKQKQSGSKDKITDTNKVSENAAEAVQYDLKNADLTADAGQLNSSDKNKTFAKNRIDKRVLRISPTTDCFAVLNNSGSTDFNTVYKLLPQHLK